ncbi:putative reverse transcriptase domain-containing protein [Tanacetum coccineum]
MSADSVVLYFCSHLEHELEYSIEDPYEEVARQLLEQAPTPPLPPSFLSPRIRPPHTRAAMRQMRAAAPSTYHSLLPSGTHHCYLYLYQHHPLAAELIFPRLTCRLRRGYYLLTPRPGCEVGKFSAALRRQARTHYGPRSTESIDTMETRSEIRERMNGRLIRECQSRGQYHGRLRIREVRSLYSLNSRHHTMAQNVSAAVRAEIGVFEERETCLRARELRPVATSSSVRIQMIMLLSISCVPRPWRLEHVGLHLGGHCTVPRTGFMIEFAAAMAEVEASRVRNGDDINSSRPRPAQTARECSLPRILKCKPLDFKGTEGVVGLTRWFEKMESVFSISNCTAASQVKFATCTLQDDALTWWNSHVKTTTPEAAHAMTWAALKKMMTDKYCPRGEIKKIKTEMWNLKVKGIDVVA